jgi:hypothetical protein
VDPDTTLPASGRATRDTAAREALADPRAMAILSTEHWSLLTARSLVYNETFSRGGMFLTLLSASLVALGFAYQGSGGGAEFPAIVVAVLTLDLFVGLATFGRIVGASQEEFRSLQAMNRIRHAYLEIGPGLAPYFSTSRYDDAPSVLEVYGPSVAEVSWLRGLLHGLTTMVGMISILDSAIAGALSGSLIVALGGDARLAIVVGIAVSLAAAVTTSVFAMRTFGQGELGLEVRFPRPDAEG